MKKFISLDVESNGLDGKPYAVAMQVYQNGKVVDAICLSCDIVEPIDSWLQENPYLLEVKGSTKIPYHQMMEHAVNFYKKHACRNENNEVVESWGSPNYNTTPILYHCGMIVEGRFFYELRQMSLLGKFERPMCPIEVGNFLMAAGENPFSCDEYVKKHNLTIEFDGGTHNPLYDCEVAAKVFIHLTSK